MFLDPRIIVIISFTGLGLSIVQSVCTAHGGDVTVENLKTGGCRFHVVLP